MTRYEQFDCRGVTSNNTYLLIKDHIQGNTFTRRIDTIHCATIDTDNCGCCSINSDRSELTEICTAIRCDGCPSIVHFISKLATKKSHRPIIIRHIWVANFNRTCILSSTDCIQPHQCICSTSIDIIHSCSSRSREANTWHSTIGFIPKCIIDIKRHNTTELSTDVYIFPCPIATIGFICIYSRQIWNGCSIQLNILHIQTTIISTTSIR